jgi:MFS family permease
LVLDDVQKRYSVFYLIGCLGSACAGILAYGLMQMDGVANKSGWRWIFIMEGIVRPNLMYYETTAGI